MDVIGLDASVVRGSHGRVEVAPEHRPVLLAKHTGDEERLAATGVRDVILETLFG